MIEEVARGIPESSLDMELELRPYHRFRQSLYVLDIVLCYKEILVILESSRERLLTTIQAAKQGITSFRDAEK